MDDPVTYSVDVSTSGDPEIDLIAGVNAILSRACDDEERTRVVNYLHQRYG